MAVAVLPRDVTIGVTDTPLFDGEQVGEVTVHEELDGAETGLVAEIGNDDVLPHPLPHIPAAPEDPQGGVGPPGSGWAAHDEGG